MIDKQFEIIVIGNSLAMDGINTEMLGKAYNLSIGGATLNTNKRQLEEYLESCQKKPKKVILASTS